MNIIVTGASRGIGFELVKLFAQDKDNCIFAISRNREKLEKLVAECKFNNVFAHELDITNEQTILHQLPVKINQLDILINNAGLLLNKPFETIEKQELSDVYDVNVFAPFRLIQKYLSIMGKERKSHIVNISSMGGFQGSAKFSGLSAYSSSKAAIAGLTECLAEELKDKNIAINCLAIGAVQTEMLEKAFPGYVAPLKPKEMASFIHDFALNGQKYFNGKILPVSLSTP